MSLPTLHLIPCFHTQISIAYSHCAFSCKSLRFPRMMRPLGYKIIEYSNAGSESGADEHVEMLSSKEFDEFYPAQKAGGFHGNYAVIGSRGWPLFNERLKIELAKRVKPGDLILHGFGLSHSEVMNMFPECTHVEPFIGYPDEPNNAIRIYESITWQHYHFGRNDHNPALKDRRGNGHRYSFVIPNFFDLDEWPFCPKNENEDYVLFMGRVTAQKGMTTIAEIIRKNSSDAKAGRAELLKFVIAGQGDFDGDVMRHIMRDPAPSKEWLNVKFLGPVIGRDRAPLVGKARCMLMPTEFTEPFGGSGVEAQITGTPLLASTWGAFPETTEHGKTGYLCRTLADWMEAIERSKNLDRKYISDRARRLYSLETCGAAFDRAFKQIADLKSEGWYGGRAQI